MKHDAVRDWLILATNRRSRRDRLARADPHRRRLRSKPFSKACGQCFLQRDGHHQRDVWLRLGRWLVAGLTFQLAADVLETAVTTSWDEVARLAAIAAIRTFLNYFLERDLGGDQNTGRERRKAIATEGEALDGGSLARGSGA